MKKLYKSLAVPPHLSPPNALVGGLFLSVCFYMVCISSALACSAGDLCQSSSGVSPGTVETGETFTLSCNYGYSGNGIEASSAAASNGSTTTPCQFNNFSGTIANFTCTAGTASGTYNNYCKLDSASPYYNTISGLPTTVGTIQVACAPAGNFCASGSGVSQGPVPPGGSFTVSCDYGFNGSGIQALTGAVPNGTAAAATSCQFNNFTGSSNPPTIANFNCTASTTSGTYNNYCTLNSGAGKYYVQGAAPDLVGQITVSDPAHPAGCPTCVSIRVGPPQIQNPQGTNASYDNPFNELLYSDGKFHGFAGNQDTHEITGTSAVSMGGAPALVLNMTSNPSDFDHCGQWMNATETINGTTYGFVHSETACDYSNNGQTHKSMQVESSTDGGMTWNSLGQIITGTSAEAPSSGQVTGEGDCTMFNGGDGYEYAYCLKTNPWGTFVARSPVPAKPSSSDYKTWYKYLNNSFSSPGLTGDATRLVIFQTSGSSATSQGADSGRLTASGDIILLDPTRPNGLQAAFSSDKINFFALPEPLIHTDGFVWGAADEDLLVYPDEFSVLDGSRQLQDTFELSYTYVPYGDNLDDRYLVFRQVSMNVSSGPVGYPQVGVALTRWYNPSTRDPWATTAAPVESNTSHYQTGSGNALGYYNTGTTYTFYNQASYATDASLGYEMNAPAPSGSPSTVQVDECVPSGYLTGSPINPNTYSVDHWLHADPCPSGYTKIRTSGWIFAKSQGSNTGALYSCYNSTRKHHYASLSSSCSDNSVSTNAALGDNDDISRDSSQSEPMGYIMKS